MYPFALLPVTQGLAKAQSVFCESRPIWPVSPQIEVTVKLTPLLATPPTVTTTFPVVAPAGTDVAMLVDVQAVVVAVVPLKVTVPEDPKFVPVIVTPVPTAPEVGLRLVIEGGGGGAEVVTVIVREGGCGSLKPWLSVTVSVVVNVPAEE